MSEFKFNDDIERISGFLKLTLWGKIKLSAYPRSTLVFAEQQLRLSKSSISNKFGYFKTICDEWCRKNNKEPNYKLAEELAITFGQPFNAPWTLDKDPDAPVNPPGSVKTIGLMEDLKPESNQAEQLPIVPTYLIASPVKITPNKDQEEALMALYASDEIAQLLREMFSEEETKKIQGVVLMAMIQGIAKIYWVPSKTRIISGLKVYTSTKNEKAIKILGKDIRDYTAETIINFLLGKIDFENAHTDFGKKNFRNTPYHLPKETYFMEITTQVSWNDNDRE
jgi:hypothetical protein